MMDVKHSERTCSRREIVLGAEFALHHLPAVGELQGTVDLIYDHSKFLASDGQQ